MQYSNAMYNDATYLFGLIREYKSSSTYIKLCECYLFEPYDFLNNKYNYDKGLSLYGEIKALGSFEDAQSIKVSDKFIFYRLEGYWRDSNGYYFQMMYNAKESGWYGQSNIPRYDGKFYKIEEQTYYLGSDEKGWKKEYSFYFDSENKMRVFCYKNNRTYILTR